jgi:SAM-dependent methyltransferase
MNASVASTTPRQTDVHRLKSVHVEADSTLYLHLRSLFDGIKRASWQARGRMLDIGCGNKPYQSVFAPRVSEHVGCDVVQSDEHRVDIFCPATDIPLPDSSFDTVLCTQVIEHVANHQGVIKEAVRLLKDGGVLILSAPMYWPLHEEPYDFFRFTKHGLTHILEEAGFVRLEIVPNGGKWALTGQALVHCLVTTRFVHWKITSKALLPLVNRIFAWLDDKYPNYNNTMNYVVVAHKPVRP